VSGVYATGPGTPSPPVRRMPDLGRAAGDGTVARGVEAQRQRQRHRHRRGPGCGHGETAVRRREAVHHDHEGADDGRSASAPGLLASAPAAPSSPLPDPLLGKAKAFHRNDGLGAGRVHDNPMAQRATAAPGAHAVTAGSHILLGPEAVGNTGILAHEAGHLDKNLRGVRETGHDNGGGVAVTDPGQGSERAADTDSAAFVAGHGTAPSVARRAAVEQGTVADGAPAVRRTLREFEPCGTFTDAVDGQEGRRRSTDGADGIRTSARLGVPAGAAPRHGIMTANGTRAPRT
ncbi:DUF4157 domain-containing protein, partial [Streptomyces sp. NPDC059456]|uniref:eCIS core domain-containing protein n=1 Tax=Streptomyces sp. NPDC059456 TaxID=3346838 RepID=UPI0036BAC3B4